MPDETKEPDDSPTATEEPAAAETPGTVAAPEEGAEEAPAKLHQTVEVKDVGPCKKHIKVTVDRGDIDQRFDEKFSELVTEERSFVQGFRPGKAPRKLVERFYKQEVQQQVKAEVLMASLEQLAEEQDIAPLAPPDLDPGRIEIPDEGPMVYEFEVEVRPEFQLPNYKGLKLKRPVQTFTDADVEREEKRLLEPYGQVVPKPEPGTVDVGDIVVADITSRDGDRVLNSVKEQRVRVDPRLALRDGIAPRFGEQMKGAKAGDERVVDIVLADTVADPALRAKTVQATFKVNDVKTVRLPDMTDELLEQFGVRTAEQLRELIRVVLERRLEYQQRQSARDQVIALVAEKALSELPRDLLIRQARRAMTRKVMEMRSAGMTDEEIVARQRLMEQDIIRSTAASLKEHFVLQKIAEDEKLDVTDDDIDDEIERIASRSDESPRRVRARLEKEDMLESLAAELLESKALDLILESAEYEDVPLTPSERETSVATVEAQAVHGEMQDPTAPESAPAEEAEAATPESGKGP
jgi:trigger factor